MIILVNILSAICSIILSVVYLCYKLIYGRVKLFRKSYKSYNRNASYLSGYPTHVHGHYKLKTRLEMTFN